VLKKPNRNSDAVDVPADNPVGTMDRFTEGLKRVLAAKRVQKPTRIKKRRHQRLS
jgi:hypothetical protein